jgi:hypothetical protein
MNLQDQSAFHDDKSDRMTEEKAKKIINKYAEQIKYSYPLAIEFRDFILFHEARFASGYLERVEQEKEVLEVAKEKK